MKRGGKQQQQQVSSKTNSQLIASLQYTSAQTRRHRARNATAVTISQALRPDTSRASSKKCKLLSGAASQKNLKTQSHSLQHSYSVSNTPVYANTAALTARPATKAKMLSPEYGTNGGKQSKAKLNSRQTSSKKIALVSSKKRTKAKGEDNKGSAEVSGRKKSALQATYPKAVRQVNTKQKNQRVLRQNLFNLYDYQRIEGRNLAALADMEFKPTISILDEQQRSLGSSNHNMFTSSQKDLGHNSSQKQMSQDQIPHPNAISKLEKPDESNYQSVGGQDYSKDKLLRTGPCQVTISPVSKATEAHQNYMDAPLSHPTEEQSEYGDPVDSSLAISQLAIKEQQSSGTFQLPLQRKTRQERLKERVDSTIEYQHKLLVKEKFNKRLTCMSPDEYRPPRAVQFNSTSNKPAGDVSKNIQIMEDIGDYQGYTSRQGEESALKT